MNKTYVFFFVLIISCSARAQNKSINEVTSSNKLPIYPPGTISMNDSLFIDKTPIINIGYLFFIQKMSSLWNFTIHDSIKKLPKFDVSESYYLNKPKNYISEVATHLKINFDTIVADNISSQHYLNYPQYSYNPVLYVSQKQAEIYCKWRTDMVMLLWAMRTKTKEERNKYPQKIKYRLPTKEELKTAKILFRQKGKLKIVNRSTPIKMKLEKPKEKYYVFNISEITMNDSVYGKNWLKKKPSKIPNNYSGFRCICEISK